MLELTRRNLRALLAKLDDPKSARSLSKVQEGGGGVLVVTAVEDSEHYSDREPGEVYMPSTGERWGSKTPEDARLAKAWREGYLAHAKALLIVESGSDEPLPECPYGEAW